MGPKRHSKKNWLRRMLKSLRALALIMGFTQLVIVVTWPWSLPLAGKLLLINETTPSQADLIVILMGETVGRAAKAVELYHQKVAPKLLFIRPEDSPESKADLALNGGAATRKFLLRAGVPTHDIEYIEDTEVTSTREEAAAIIARLRLMHQPTRVVVVTSWYHTARARWIFSQAAKDTQIQFQIAAAFPDGIRADNWYRDERSFLLVFEEYLKWTHNWIKSW